MYLLIGYNSEYMHPEFTIKCFTKEEAHAKMHSMLADYDDAQVSGTIYEASEVIGWEKPAFGQPKRTL